MSANPPRATIDFETRSACPIRKTGSWRYSLDPTTQPLCLAFRLPYWEAGRTGLWHPAFDNLSIPEQADDDLAELFLWLLQGELVEAHNAWFERGVWTNIMAPKFGWPEVPTKSWRCSAAKAAAYALPRSLDHAVTALRLPIHKDLDGAKVMKKMAKPRKPRKKERETWLAQHGDTVMPLLYHESPELLDALWAYCRQDVLTEEALSESLEDLSPEETQLYLLDQDINQRGFQIDVRAAERALTLIQTSTEDLNAELGLITQGNPDKATQRAKMQEWLAGRGLWLPDTQKATIAEALVDAEDDDEAVADDEIPAGLASVASSDPEVKRALEILQTLSLSSTAKFQAMTKWVCPDGRVRGGLLFNGASTLRWSGAGIQPHNFPKGCFKESDYPMTEIWDDVFALSVGQLEARYGCSAMKVLSHALRGAITAAPGKHLYVADYASIEVRVLLWLANDSAHLDMLRHGVDMYVDMASKVYARPLTKDDKTERSLGKLMVLGLGYGMGAVKFTATAHAVAGMIISEDFAQTAVQIYRDEYWLVQQLWYDTQDAAIAAVNDPGTEYLAGRVVYVVEDSRFLYAYLPSGRRLVYPFPEVRERETPWGAMKPSLTYMGVDARTHQWTRQHSYGALLVENNCQSEARTILASAMVRASHSSIYTPILTVHDELMCEAHPLLGDVREFERLLVEVPAWAEGCPIAAEAWSGPRYHK